MISVERKEDATVDKAMNLAYEEIKQQAPKAKLTFIEKDENSEYPSIIFSIESPRFINDRMPESQLWYIIIGKQRLYTNFRAIKMAEISIEQKENWIKFFKNIKFKNE